MLKDTLKKRSRVMCIFDIMLMLLLVIECNTVFFNMHSKLIYGSIFFVLLLLNFNSLKIFFEKNINVAPLFKFLIFFLIFMTVFIWINYQIHEFNLELILTYVLFPIMISIYLYCIFSQNLEKWLLIVLKRIIVYLAVISLFFWFMSLVNVPTNSSSVIDWGGIRSVPGYFKIHYLSQGSINFFGINVIRNTGIFVEAPMYSFVLSIALLISAFNEKVEHFFNNERIILIFTILSTTSTTGIITVLLVLAYYFLQVKKSSFRLFLNVFIIPLLILVFIIVLSNKFNNSWASSLNLRIDDFHAGYLSWRNNIIFGNGLKNDNAIKEYMDQRRFSYMSGTDLTGLSSGVMSVLSYGGIFLLSFYLLPIVVSIKVSKSSFGMASISFILFVFTVIDSKYIYIFLLCYFYINYIEVKSTNQIKGGG